MMYRSRIEPSFGRFQVIPVADPFLPTAYSRLDLDQIPLDTYDPLANGICRIVRAVGED